MGLSAVTDDDRPDDTLLPDDAPGSVTVTTGGSAAVDRATTLIDAGDGSIVAGGITTGELEPGKKAGGNDIFLVRHRADRSVAWVRQIGSDGDDFLTAVTQDDAGALYAVGYTYGTMGTKAFGNADIMIAKYAADGTPLWIRQFGSDADDIAFSGTAIGPAIYIGGSTGGDLVPGNLPQQGDGFIMELDRDGTVLRSTLLGSTNADRVTALFAGGANTLYAAGETGGSLHGNNSFGNTDGFIANFDLSLSRRWTRQFGTPGADTVLAGAADATGIALAGMTFGSFDDEINEGNYDALLMLCDLNGDRLFSRQHGNDGPDFFNGVAFSPDGSIIAVGTAAGAVFTQPAAGGYEIIAVRYDRSGERLATLQQGSAEDDGAYAVTARDDGATLGGIFANDYFIMNIKW